MKKALSILLFSLYFTVAYSQSDHPVHLESINNLSDGVVATICYDEDISLRPGYIFLIYNNENKIGRLEVDSVGFCKAFGFIVIQPAYSNYDSLIENHRLSLYRSYFIDLTYTYEFSIVDNNDKLQNMAIGFDYYPSFNKYKKNDRIWIGADVGYLFGQLNDETTVFSDLTHVYVRFEIGDTPFYNEKTMRSFMYGLSIRPHPMRFYIEDYFGYSEDMSTDANIYVYNTANIFIGFQFAAFIIRVESNFSKMYIDNTYRKDMTSICFRAGFNF